MSPSFVNIGVSIGDGTLVDSCDTVGSCAQIGENVKLGANALIGGVLEPVEGDSRRHRRRRNPRRWLSRHVWVRRRRGEHRRGEHAPHAPYLVYDLVDDEIVYGISRRIAARSPDSWNHDSATTSCSTAGLSPPPSSPSTWKTTRLHRSSVRRPCDDVFPPADPDNPPVRRLADWSDDRLEALADEHGTPLYVIDLYESARMTDDSPGRSPTRTFTSRRRPTPRRRYSKRLRGRMRASSVRRQAKPLRVRRRIRRRAYPLHRRQPARSGPRQGRRTGR